MRCQVSAGLLLNIGC
uniref:Uncharacterized protein n=1 Tax=Arundo donax TaxID=35708 RepID=A0A0A9FC92_ARUDO